MPPRNIAEFDRGQLVQVTTLAGLKATTVSPATASWEEIFGAVHMANHKEKAPAIIPATFKSEAVAFTKKGRPNKTQVLASTVILLDFDSGAIESGAIEQAFEDLGLACTYWSTWSATITDPRWRIAIPMASPILYKHHEQVWMACARAVVNRLQIILGDPTLDSDWSQRHTTQPCILPCRPDQVDVAYKNGWGGVTPRPVHLDGLPIIPDEVTRTNHADHYGHRLAFVTARRHGHGGVRGVPVERPTPYKGNPEAVEAPKTVAAWRADRRTTVGLTAGLDAVERLRRAGLGSTQGGRGSIIAGAAFHLYRCGWPVGEIRDWGMATLAATTGRDPALHLLNDLQGQLRDFQARQDRPDVIGWAVAAQRVVLESERAPWAQQHDALAHFIAVLTRADHLRRAEGGQLSFAEIAKVIGIPMGDEEKKCAAVVAWRRTLEEAGLLVKWGEGRTTHYRLNEVPNG